MTRASGDLRDDRGLLRTIVKSADQQVGVYANVLVPAPLEAGDRVTVDPVPDRSE